MNLLFGVPALAARGRLKAGLRTDRTPQTRSWSLGTVARPRRLSKESCLVAAALPLVRIRNQSRVPGATNAPTEPGDTSGPWLEYPLVSRTVRQPGLSGDV